MQRRAPAQHNCEDKIMSSVIRGAALVFVTCLPLQSQARPQTPDPQQLFQEAVTAQQRGDDAVALRKYRELLRVHPGAMVVRANLGATFAHLKRYDEAVEQYRAVLAAEPGNGHVRLNLAVVYQERGDLPRAVAELELLRQKQPEDMQAALLLADCYRQLKRYSDAVKLLKAIQPQQPDDLDLQYLLGLVLIQSGRAEEGAGDIEKVAEKAANAEAYLLAGQTRLGIDQYDLALTDAQAALRLNPALAGAQTLLGMVLEHTGDFRGATAALEQALRANERDFDAHFYLGSILYFDRDLPAAKLHLQRARQLRPESSQAQYKLALIAIQEGHLEVALKELQIVIRDSPDWLEAHVELAGLYYRLHRPEDGARERLLVDRLATRQPPGR